MTEPEPALTDRPPGSGSPRPAPRRSAGRGTGDIDEQTALGERLPRLAAARASCGWRCACSPSSRSRSAGCRCSSAVLRLADSTCSGCRCRGCCWRCSCTRGWCSLGLAVRAPRRAQRGRLRLPAGPRRNGLTVDGVPRALARSCWSPSRPWRRRLRPADRRAPPATSTSPPAPCGRGLNASAIGGEYLSAASLPRRRRAGAGRRAPTCSGTRSATPPATWCCWCWSAAPLRRSGAYTLPDFAEARLDSRAGPRGVRRCSSSAIGWLYLLPQFQGAGLTLRPVIDAPRWVGAGGRSSSWCSSASSPAACARSRSCRPSSTGSSSPRMLSRRRSCSWSGPATAVPGATDGRGVACRSGAGREQGLYTTYSLVWRRSSARWASRTWWSASTPTPTAGRPAAPRWWCSGCSARSTCFPPLYAARPGYGPTAAGERDAVVLLLPQRIIPGTVGDLLTALSPPARSRRSCRRPPGSRPCRWPACSPARRRELGDRGPRSHGLPALGGVAAVLPAGRSPWPSPTSSVADSRARVRASPRRRSARCWCSASGGAA